MRQAFFAVAVSVFVGWAALWATDSSATDRRAVGEEAHLTKSPDPGTLFLYPERIALQEGGFFAAERGTLFVPENRSKEDSRVISIEIYRFKRSSKADPATPPIFYLHGGPSFRGLERSLEELGTFEEHWRPMLDVSDVVVVSQRGIGPSKPTTVIKVATTPKPPDQPFDDE